MAVEKITVKKEAESESGLANGASSSSEEDSSDDEKPLMADINSSTSASATPTTAQRVHSFKGDQKQKKTKIRKTNGAGAMKRCLSNVKISAL